MRRDRAYAFALRFALLANLFSSPTAFLFYGVRSAGRTHHGQSHLALNTKFTEAALSQKLCDAYQALPDVQKDAIPTRPLPSFLIVGAQKAGTTFLHSVLAKAPGVAAPISQPAFADGRESLPPVYRGITKELHYFDRANLGSSSFVDEYLQAWGNTSSAMMFESTPGYLPTPMAPYRIKSLMPNTKIIIMLREPSSRALSHWNMRQTFCQKHEKRIRCPRSFEDAVKREIRALDSARCRLNSLDPPGASWNRCFGCYFEAGCDFTEGLDTKAWFQQHIDREGPRNECAQWSDHAGYVWRGMYAAQISWWLEFFPASQIYIVNQDDLSAAPMLALRRIFDFLGLDVSDGSIEKLISHKANGRFRGSYKKNSQLGSPQASGNIVQGLRRLQVFYAAHNANLYRLLKKMGVDGFSKFNVTKTKRSFQPDSHRDEV